MGLITARTLKSARRKVAIAVRKHNRGSGGPNRAIDFVSATNKKGVYAYGTRERR